MQVRLDKSEMPYPPSAMVIQAVKKSIECINRYTPKSKVNELYRLLSEYSNVAPESLILSFGSDILIKEFIYLFSKERQIIVADPTFFLITTTAQKTQSPLYRIKLKEPNFELSLETF
ncbi:MAG: aminotransferase class I/II-fold pyridoxal phosphate-dependent enzyme, partial [Promethearchaeota archaeon]